MRLETYLKQQGISKRTLYNRISEGTIFTYTDKGVRHVVERSELANSKIRKKIIKEIVAEFEPLISRGHFNPDSRADIVQEIQMKVEEWKDRGVEIKGWSSVSCYRKMKTMKLQRQTRSDKFSRKNPILQDSDAYQKLKALVYNFYQGDKSKRPSVRLVTQRIEMLSKKREEYWELAAIPRSTLRDNVTKIIDRFAIDEKHVMENAYNSHRRKRLYNEGAFTRDLKFMETFMLDDKVMDVAGTQVWNELRGKFETRKIYMWMVIEGKTMFPLAYEIKTREFKAEDVKQLLLKALMQMGRPKVVLMDNGLAATKKCVELLDRLGIAHDPGPAYEPLHKQPVERMFGTGFVKTEFNAQWKNYIGGGRAEVRHTGKRLSPEEADHTVEQFIREFDNYIEGFYQIREREITDEDFKKELISIRDNFNRHYMYYEKEMIDPVKLRLANMEYAIKKVGYQMLEFGKHGIYSPSPGHEIHPVLCDKKYAVYYNPLDMQSVDLYAIEDHLIEETGETKEKGMFVATFESLRSKSNRERQALVAETNKKFEKQLRKAAESAIDVNLAKGVHAFMPELNEAGSILNKREELHEKMRELESDFKHRATRIDIPESKKASRVNLDEPEEVNLFDKWKHL